MRSAAYIITVESSLSSRTSAARCLQSSASVRNKFVPALFWATTPDDVEKHMTGMGLIWDYPDEGTRVCPHTGLELHAYKSRDVAARVACFASHARLWMKSVDEDRPLLILEDDALFMQELPFEEIVAEPWGAIGINDPRKATRKANVYHFAVVRGPKGKLTMRVPRVDGDDKVPSGLAGGSAYVIKPWAARALLDKAREIGAWPNDALMCSQLFPFLGQTTSYYTRVQNRPSSLS